MLSDGRVQVVPSVGLIGGMDGSVVGVDVDIDVGEGAKPVTGKGLSGRLDGVVHGHVDQG